MVKQAKLNDSISRRVRVKDHTLTLGYKDECRIHEKAGCPASIKVCALYLEPILPCLLVLLLRLPVDVMSRTGASLTTLGSP